MITWFEKNYYQNSFIRGVYLVLFIVGATGFIGILFQEYISHFFSLLLLVTSAFIASMFISYKALYDSIYKVLTSEDKKEVLSKLTDLDTKNMSESTIYKTSIEIYTKNLTSKVTAPLLYLLFFGLPGIIVYKAVDTMDSMLRYNTQKYELYRRAAVLLNDLLNYIPARITAILIMLFSDKKDLFAFYEEGQKHENPNTGHPVIAMGLALDLKLGKLKGRQKKITEEDLRRALTLLPK